VKVWNRQIMDQRRAD